MLDLLISDFENLKVIFMSQAVKQLISFCCVAHLYVFHFTRVSPSFLCCYQRIIYHPLQWLNNSNYVHGFLFASLLYVPTNSIAFTISSCNTLSSSLKLTIILNSLNNSSNDRDVFNGLLKSSACAALSNSIAKTFSTLSTTRKHFVAALAPMLT